MGCNLQYHIDKTVKTYTVHLLNHPNIYQPHYVNNCLCNEVAGLELRALAHSRIKLPYIYKFRKYLDLYYHYFVANGIGVPASYEEIISRYTCSKRKRYEKAYSELMSDGLDYYFDAKVNTFVKVAKFNIDSKWDTKQNKLCRTVNTRSYKFTLELLRYIHPIEEVLMDYTYDGYPCIAKGKSLRQRAIDIHNIFYSFADPVVISLDLTAFDMHITKQMLREEFKLYNRLYNCKDIRRLTSAMLVNHITTEHGIKRKISGQRMSGDATTACGNVIQMTCILQVAMEGYNYKFYDDGDDCLLFIESNLFSEVKEKLLATYSAFGHELKIENVAHEFSDIVFCQHRPFEDSFTGEINLIPDPWKVLSQMTSHYRYYNQPNYGIRMFKTIMFGYASVYQHVPIISKYAAKFVEIFKNKKMLINVNEDDNEFYYWFNINKVNFRNESLVDDIKDSIMSPDLIAFLDYYYDFHPEDIQNITEQIENIDPTKLNFKFRHCGSGYYNKVKYS